jgi:exonuclease III
MVLKTKLPSSSGEISVASWNVQGLRTRSHSKLDDPDFVNDIVKHDIVFLSETHSNEKDNIQIEGFHVTCNHRDKLKQAKKHFGGVIVAIKKDIKKGVKIVNVSKSDEITIKLRKDFFNFDKDLFVKGVYIPPVNSTYSKRVRQLPNHVNRFEQLKTDVINDIGDSNYIVMGDMNGRTGVEDDGGGFDGVNNDHLPITNEIGASTSLLSRKSCDDTCKIDVHGREILDLCKETGLRILNGRKFGDIKGNFTCVTPRGKSVIDYALADYEIYNNIKYFSVNGNLNGLSDHCKIELCIRGNFKRVTEPTVKHKMLPKVKWNDDRKVKYIEHINEPGVSEKIVLIRHLIEESTKSVDDILDLIYDSFDGIMKTVFPVKKHTQNKKKVMRKKWYDKDCNRMKNEVKYLCRQMNKNPYDKSIHHKYQIMVKNYNKLLRFKKRKFTNDVLERLENMRSNNPKEYWKLFNDLKKEEENKEVGSVISINEWKEYLSKLFGPKEIDIAKNIEMINKIKSLEGESTFNELNFIIKRQELDKALLEAKLNKAVGIDAVSVEMLKYSSESMKETILKLFNKILSMGEYPEKWNIGYISTIHKAGPKENPDNYRCLTIISCLGKIFGSILNNRLQEFLEKYNIIKNTQIGFKKKSRTQDHMFVLKTVIDKYKMLKKDLFVCFVDFSKAYDNVWRNALLYKILLQNVGGNFYKCIKNMYAKTLCVVKEGNYYSDPVETLLGVRQGDPLSPALFNLFTNDIPDLFDDSCKPVMLNESSIQCLQYADDIVIFSESKEGLQQCLTKLEQYCKVWEMSVNTKKTQIMVYSNKRSRPNYQFMFNDATLNIVDEYKYLGCIFSNNRNFKKCTELLADKAKRATFYIKKILKQNNLSPSHQLNIFDKMVVPIMTYGAEIWCGDFIKKLTKTDKNDCIPAEKIHRHYIKYVLGVHRKASNDAVMAESGRYPIFGEAIKLFINYANHLINAKPGSLLKEANEVAKDLENHNIGWWYEYRKIIKSLDYDNEELVMAKEVKLKFQEKIRETTISNIKKGKKLRTYCLFKDIYKYEPYLDQVKNVRHRKDFTRLRISAHDLNIERGRYANLQVEKRLCKFCNNIEDEKHVMMICEEYSDIRKLFLDKLIKINPNLAQLDCDNCFIYIMSSEDEEFTKSVSHFVTLLFAERSKKMLALCM